MSDRRGAAVLGSPIEHSLSPALHQAAYESLGLRGWTYRAIRCEPAELAERLSELDGAGLAGVSLTMPLKRAVLPLLTHADPVVVESGVANTVIFGPDGCVGANTDIGGIAAALATAAVTDLSGQAPLLIGAGATAASALAAVAGLGARRVTVAARRVTAIGSLSSLAEAHGVAIAATHLQGLSPSAFTSSLVVSTVPKGAADWLVSILPPSLSGTLLDVVYDGWPSPLADAWSRAGGVVVGGLELLVQQAALQVDLMTGQLPDISILRKAGGNALLPVD